MKKIVLSLVLVLMLVLAVGAASANGSLDAPISTTMETLQNSELYSGNTADYYQIDMTESGILRLEIASRASHIRCYLYDAEKRIPWNGTFDWTSEDSMTNKTQSWYLTKGTYVLKVTYDESISPLKVAEEKAWGVYEFKTFLTGAKETFQEACGGENNTRATASNIDSYVGSNWEGKDAKEVRGQLALNDKVDYFYFKTTAEKSDLYLYFYNNINPLKTATQTVTLTNENQEVIETVTLTDGFVESIWAADVPAGYYYLSVSYPAEGQEEASWGNFKFKAVAHVHNFVKQVAVKATPTADGYYAYQCECGAVEKTEVIAKPYSIKTEYSKYTYTGAVIHPTVIVKERLTATSPIVDMDPANYTVSYESGCKKSGEYKVTVKFDSALYTGSIKLSFQIVPQTPVLSKLSGSAKSLTVKWKPLSTTSSSHLSGYEIQASTSKKFKNVKVYYATAGRKVTTGYVKNLPKGKKMYVRVRAYRKTGGKYYYSDWSNIKSKTVR